MPTIRQKKLAKAVVENLSRDQPLNKKELLVSAGYNETTAGATPTRILEQAGVQEELQALGFDPYAAKQVVGQILMDGENDSVKLKAADMIFKVAGSYAAEKHVNLNINTEQNDKLDLLIARIEHDLDTEGAA